jgi:general secretion pathway protein C
MSAWLDKFKQFDLKQMDRAAPVLLAVLILVLCWKLASLFWLLLAPPQAMQLERVELGSQQAQVPNISSFSLFQEAVNASGADQQLNMILQGVVVAYPSQFSSAVIKANETAERYRVGESVAGSSYTLAEVYWDRAILRTSSGSVKELQFNGIENGLNQPIVPAATASQEAAPNPALSTSDTAISQAVQRMQENREQYMQEMGVNTSSNGSGYEVTARTPVGLRNKLGLQPGDRIVSLNGQTVGQNQTEAQLLEQARREGQVRLEVKRGDQVVTIQQDFK